MVDARKGIGEIKKEEYMPSVAVAALDILGIKALLDKGDKSKSAMQVLKDFILNAEEYQLFKVPRMTGEYNHLYDEEVYLGDSVYLFADEKKGIKAQVDRLAIKCSAIITAGLIITNKHAVRAGIAVGDLRKLVVKTARGDKELRIGTAMSGAHMLQDSQVWLGGAIAAGLEKGQKELYRIKYDIPCEPEYEGELEALNWVHVVVHSRGYSKEEVMKLVEETMSKPGNIDTAAVKVKLENTKKFVEYVFDNKEY